MAYTVLAPITLPSRAGMTIADAAMTAAVAGGHSVVNDGYVQLELLNTSAVSVNVTIGAPNLIDTYAALPISGLLIVLPAGNVTPVRQLTPFFPRTIYNQSDGTIHIDYSATTSVKVMAIQHFRELTQ
jgi:hypothetical protein